MPEKPIFALLYDFDHTLSPRDMQEYAFIPGLGMEDREFWDKCDEAIVRYNMDPILAYMYVMLEQARGKMLITRDVLKELGKGIGLFKGVSTWFKRVNAYAEKAGMKAEHYIISSGLKEIIEGTSIADEFEKIYAAEYVYNEYNEPVWPAMAVNFSSKTQFLYRINKGTLDIADNVRINEYMSQEERRVPFRNMIYFGDGYTDVPCMKLVHENGGHSIAIYQDSQDRVNNLIINGRVDLVAQADYSKGSEIEEEVFAIIDQSKATNKLMAMHKRCYTNAKIKTGHELIDNWQKHIAAEKLQTESMTEE